MIPSPAKDASTLKTAVPITALTVREQIVVRVLLVSLFPHRTYVYPTIPVAMTVRFPAPPATRRMSVQSATVAYT